MVKKTIGNCVICNKLEGKLYKVAQAADLPDFRVREAAPFSKVGVDFAGPLFAKCCKDGTDKVYIALFSCCVTRAITELYLYIWRWRSPISAEAKNMAEQATYSHEVFTDHS